jgi:glycosyltransferase 2 family protein
VTASTGRLVVPVLIVLLASAVPTSIAGWGPREGAAAWAFGSAGLSAAQGVTVATVYGVMVLVAVLPGLAVLLSDRGQRAAPDRLMSEELVHV